MNRLLAPAAVLLVAGLATGCGRALTHPPHTTSTPVCTHVTTTVNGDYVTAGRRPCLLTTSPPAHTTVTRPANTTATAPTNRSTTPTKTVKPTPTRTPVHLSKTAAPAKTSKSNSFSRSSRKR
ncbi:hypothetical protein OG896_24860 [Streptomyces sp. NBC_00669]|uniref:hypothetical protein n=1 Tax=Streptomyces sp. NBC_00669 TaxID=2976011 RepID=UPI002E315E2B|nr:hypothetical protein [Streptomyces sp. NBC_00669]